MAISGLSKMKLEQDQTVFILPFYDLQSRGGHYRYQIQ